MTTRKIFYVLESETIIANKIKGFFIKKNKIYKTKYEKVQGTILDLQKLHLYLAFR